MKKIKLLLFSNLYRNIPDNYIKDFPDEKIAVNIFKDEWASELPLKNIKSGVHPLFNDDRINWFIKEVGGVKKKNILELGPLEGGHSYMLEKNGAGEITGIEANSRAYLRCLIVKELFNLRNVRFRCGDFLKYLEAPGPVYDMVIACGVLYHLIDPHRLFELLAKRCKGPVFLWTHYWSENYKDKKWHKLFSSVRKVRIDDDVEIELHHHEYSTSFFSKKFLGGNAPYSEWLTRESLFNCIDHFGFNVKSIEFDNPDQLNGPAIAMILIPKKK